jgi:isopentenyldiphosphate isomerase
MSEMNDIVDEDDKIIGKATREKLIEEKLPHRGAWVIVSRSNGEFVVAKRSMKKDKYQGYWGIGVAETVQSGESYEDAAIRGLKEELGICSTNICFLFKMTYQPIEPDAFRSNNNIYGLIYDGTITPNKHEVSTVGYYAKNALVDFISREKIMPAARAIFEKYLQVVK